jgi:hypothetical protein
VQPIKLSGGRERVAKKTYSRASRFQSPGFDKALAACKADKIMDCCGDGCVPGHAIMADAPEWLAEQLLQAA